jgi:hypothetical protein
MKLFNSRKALALFGLLIVTLAAGCVAGQGYYPYGNSGYGSSYPYNSGYQGSYPYTGGYRNPSSYNQYQQNRQTYCQQYLKNLQIYNQRHPYNQQSPQSPCNQQYRRHR